MNSDQVSTLQKWYDRLSGDIQQRIDNRQKFLRLLFAIYPIASALVIKTRVYEASFMICVAILILLLLFWSDQFHIVVAANYCNKIEELLVNELDLPIKGWEMWSRNRENGKAISSRLSGAGHMLLYFLTYTTFCVLGLMKGKLDAPNKVEILYFLLIESIFIFIAASCLWLDKKTWSNQN